MAILNRRNAMLGWAAWQIAKRVMKRKARAAVPGTAEGSRRPNVSALLALAAAAVGALWFWRSRSDDDAVWPDSPPPA